MEWLSSLFSPKRLELGHRSASTSDGDEAETSEDDYVTTPAKRITTPIHQQPISMRLVVRPLQQQQQQQVERPHITLMILRDDEYFQECHHRSHQKSIAQCYDRFVLYSPLVRFNNHTKFSAMPHLCGLEYLMKPGERPLLMQQSVEFPCIYLAGGGGGGTRPVDSSGETFLVNRLLDYVYHYIIEFAYMGNQLDPRIPKSMHRQRQLHRSRRMKIYSGGITSTTHDYVLYTNRTSAFFRECMALLGRNRLLLYDDSVLDLVPLSFNLVNFLCGPLSGGGSSGGSGDDGTTTTTTTTTQQVTNYDQWVIVPLYFIDLWNALKQRSTEPISSPLLQQQHQSSVDENTTISSSTSTSTCQISINTNDNEATRESADPL